MLQTFKKKFIDKTATVAIVGFGYIGSSIGAFLLKEGLKVIGVDPRSKAILSGIVPDSTSDEPRVLEYLLNGLQAEQLLVTDDYAEVSEADLVLLTVGTPLGEGNKADLEPVKKALKSLSKVMNPKQLLILKSTVPPGTTSGLAYDILHKGKEKDEVLLAFCPERVAQGNVIQELSTLDVIIGGVNDTSTSLAKAFYQEVFGVDVKEMENTTAAELVKLANNMWIDLNIALANELAKVCEAENINALEVIEAANTLEKGTGKVNILKPSVGIGGSCLTKDPWFLQDIAESHDLNLYLPGVSRKVNDTMPGYSVELLKKELKTIGKSMNGVKIALFGVAFKSNTGDCRNTPAIEIFQSLKNSGAEIRVYDPLVSKSELQKLFKGHVVHNVFEAIHAVDAVMFLTGHQVFQTLNFESWKERVVKNLVIFDGRMYFNRKQQEEFRNFSWIYKGIAW